jgi:hypothetical protein
MYFHYVSVGLAMATAEERRSEIPAAESSRVADHSAGPIKVIRWQGLSLLLYVPVRKKTKPKE